MKWKTEFLMIVLLWLPMACTPGKLPQYEPFEPLDPQDATREAKDSGEVSHWWAAFEDAQLEALILRVLKENKSMDQAMARLTQVEAMQKQARSPQWPSLNVGLSANRSKVQSFPQTTTGDGFATSLSASYEVDLWKKWQHTAQARQFDHEAAVWDSRGLALSLSAQATEFYFLILENLAKTAVIEETIAARQTQLDLLTKRYAQGLATSLDVYQAKLSLAKAKSQLPDVLAQGKRYSHGLCVLSGEKPSEAWLTRLEGQTLPDTLPLSEVKVEGSLLKGRPDIQAALYRLSAGREEVAVAIAKRFPSLTLSGEAGYAESHFGMSLSDMVWKLLASLTAPLFDAGARKAEVRRQEAVFAERSAFYQQTVLNAFLEAQDALVMLHAAKTSRMLLAQEMEAAQLTLDLAQTQYQNGMSDYLNVINAQLATEEARLRQISAHRAHLSQWITLARSTAAPFDSMDVSMGDKP
jgi:NodT family efflux transporter outer membrane factor (OMF) lipoprotein